MGSDGAAGGPLFCILHILQIKIPMPGGDATSLHIGNAFCVLAALLLGGGYGGLAGAVGMTIADLLDPVYILGAPKTFVLKFCIGLITDWWPTELPRSERAEIPNTFLSGVLSPRCAVWDLM